MLKNSRNKEDGENDGDGGENSFLIHYVQHFNYLPWKNSNDFLTFYQHPSLSVHESMAVKPEGFKS